ncbi:chaperone protein dnaJ 49 [Rutidosis leptorrhynchoides]|uniref:chaperone protein dnaJ 49 n=1 Tax=Rutidosis leptorrhynchoides TaxID=125765 RepID=UPI003A9A65F8
MDGNKDEALRCRRIVEESIALGKKERAMKFIKIAQRLDHNLPVADLLAACEKLDSGSPSHSPVNANPVDEKKTEIGLENANGNGDGLYTEEHVYLIKKINRNQDYYAVLGLEKKCSVEEIRKAYRKMSLKVHPDKNKAPGSEEAFKKVCKAFKCLSDQDSRRQYDQVGLVDEFESDMQQNYRPRRRRRRTTHDFYEDDFDPDEIFRSFFGRSEMYRASHVYRSGGMGGFQREEVPRGGGGGGSNLMILLQILPFLLIFLLASLPFPEPEYSLHKNLSYQVPKKTEKLGVDFYVKSSFDESFPLGSDARSDIEDSVIKDYKNMLWRYCHIEMQKQHWNKNLPTPHCNKLQNLGLA